MGRPAHGAGGPVADIFPVVCTEAIEASRDFYAALLGLEVVLESGWYTLLRAPGAPEAQLGLVTRGHPSVPEGFGRRPQGVLVTVEVADVDAAHDPAPEPGGSACPSPLCSAGAASTPPSRSACPPATTFRAGTCSASRATSRWRRSASTTRCGTPDGRSRPGRSSRRSPSPCASAR